MRYQINSTGQTIIADQAFMDAVHPSDYTLLPDAPYTPPVPESVTRRQAKQALLINGKLSLVQTAIDAIPDASQRSMIQIEWDDSQEFQRNRASVIAIGSAIGLTSSQLDELFVLAATL